MFMDAIGSATQKGTRFKNAAFGLGIMVVKISAAAAIFYALSYLSDKFDLKPANPAMDADQGM